jgi:hypothetical protein
MNKFICQNGSRNIVIDNSTINFSISKLFNRKTRDTSLNSRVIHSMISDCVGELEVPLEEEDIFEF